MTEEEFTKKVKTELSKAKFKKRHIFRTIQLATISQDGIPNIRSVILRNVSFDEGCVIVHTDRRSQKVKEIIKNSSGAIHMWDPQSKLQLRWSGIFTLHREGDLFEKVWSKEKPQSLKLYLAPGDPGSELDLESKKFHKKKLLDLTKADVESGVENFCVIEFKAKSVDALFLRSSGHLRAFYEYEENKVNSFTWLNP